MESQDCEVCLPGILGFAMFKVDNRLEDIKLYGGNPLKYAAVKRLMKYCTKIESILIAAVKRQPKFCRRAPTPIPKSW
mgnify:FL=1